MESHRFGKIVVKMRYVILIASILLLIPAALGYLHTRINYDMLSYLPEDIETMKGQKIMVDEFGTGGFSMIVCEGMKNKDVLKMKEKMSEVPHVDKIVWYDSIADISIPAELFPDRIRRIFLSEDGNATMMVAVFDVTMSSDEAMEAVRALRKIANEQTFISGMTAVVEDTRELSDREAPVYVLIAVILCTIVLMLTMDSFLAPLFFLLSIGFAVIYNLGTNIVFGQVSYVTKALAAVLQLGVTLDYSIFLWHSYEEQKTLLAQSRPDECDKDMKQEAMAAAISATLSSVVGSSVTTMAGFLALCFMSFTLGKDLGLVMAKGVLFGVVGCVTVLPSMLLIFDRAIERTHHRALLPQFKKIPRFVQRFYPLLLIAFALIWIPAVKGYFNTQVYYNLDSTLPKSLPSVTANRKLSEDFGMNTTQMILVPSDMDPEAVSELCGELKKIDGIKSVLGIDALIGSEIPRELLPGEILQVFEKGGWQMLLMMSEYKTASPEVNRQCSEITQVISRYDSRCMLVGEAACTKDLIEITNHDFNTVNWVSIGVIAVIILFVFRSVSLPVILVAAIEFAIFINMGIPYYTGTTLPFIASIVIGTIQLGSTVDYAILMTTRYRTERASGKNRKESICIAHSTSIASILVSAFSFFAATFGVGLYSEIDMISSLCTLMARGALISMVTVIFILPALLYAFDRVILYTSLGFRPKKQTDISGTAVHSRNVVHQGGNL